MNCRSLPNIFFFLILLFCTPGCQPSGHKEFWPNGHLKSDIHIKDNIYEGKATWWYESGIKQMECFYKNNLLDSVMMRWYESGNKQEEQYYRNNKKHGAFTKWDPSGNIISQGSYYMGLPDGIFREWYTADKIKAEGEYRMGNIDGTWLYYDALGLIIGRGDFINGTGQQKAYYENGVIKRESTIHQNKKDGPEKFYNSDGKLIEVRIYKTGELVETKKLNF